MATHRTIRAREMLAFAPDHLRSGPDAIWWDQGPAIKPNERHGAVCVVRIHGALEHHPTGEGDCYEAIIERAREAVLGGEDDDAPSAVVLAFDSPGGVVSGLNECAASLRKLSSESGIPFIAYVEGLMASAAYALSTSCDEVYLPESGITGSIGVISMMVEQTKADQKAGVRFVTLTSGARKADGHPHIPISPDAERAEQRRVDKLAQQFFRMVSRARGMSTAKIAALEAGIFLGPEAVQAGLADDVMTFDNLIASLNEQKELDGGAKKRSLQPRMTLTSASVRRDPMSKLALQALVTRTEATLKATRDPKERKALLALVTSTKAAIEAYKRVKKTVKYEAESDEGDEQDEAEEAEAADEEDDEESAKGNETDRKEGDDGDDSDDDKKDDDSDEEDDEEGDEDDEEAAAKTKSGKPPMGTKALLALAQQATGKRGQSAVGALAAMISEGQRAKAVVDQIQKERTAEKKSAMIGEALSKRRVTKPEAKMLATKRIGFVRDFLDMRPKALIVTGEDELFVPSTDAKGNTVLPSELEKSINEAMAVAGEGKTPEQRAAIRQSMVEAHKQRMNGSAAGRY